MLIDPPASGRADANSWAGWLGACAVALVVQGAVAGQLPGQLPVPCIASLCGSGNPTSWLGAGSASLSASGNQMTINQSSASALLNWSSFNISNGSTVTFAQPSASSIAVNRIFQANPAQIFGALNANGVVYLLNQNGILFGAGSQVNVGGLVASSLDITPAALANGIGAASSVSQPSFQPFVDANGNPLVSAPVTIAQGASINASAGQVLVFAPTVTNQGTITTPDGQTILGAGQRIFLADSLDSNLRGLLIEVGGQGAVTNGSLGQIIADRGNVTLAGLAVNQDGLVSASTTVRENGSIVLEATSLVNSPTLGIPGLFETNGVVTGDTNGVVTLGSASTTEVNLEGSSSDKTVAVNAQPQSLVSISGATIDLLNQASILANAGQVTLSAAPIPGQSTTPTSGRIYLAPSSVIDVSGAQTSLPMSDNQLTVHLTSTELADEPQQKDGPLLGQNITVDLRDYGTNADGSVWVGTPLANLSSDISAIQQDVFQRSLNAGTITLDSSSSVLISPTATLNLAGGSINWQGGDIKTSALLTAQGQVVPIAQANPQLSYLGTLDAISVSDPRWQALASLSIASETQYYAGYVQGANAGNVTIVSPVTVIDGSINGSTVAGPLQRIPVAQAALGAPTFNQLPLGASLSIGDPSAFGSTSVNNNPETVTFAPGLVLDTWIGAAGGAFDPLSDPLPNNAATQVRPDLLGVNEVAALTVSANGSITIPAGIALQPGAGGSVALFGGQVSVAGTIEAPAGSIVMEAGTTATTTATGPVTPELSLAPSAQLLVEGGWVNDNPRYGNATAPLYTAGGNVTLFSSGGSMVLAAGSLIDVSSGAQLTASSSVVPGAAGSLKITDSLGQLSGPNGAVVLDATLQGFGLNKGAALAISVPSLCVSVLECVSPDSLQIAPALLTADGFASVALTGNQGSLTVGSDVDVALAQRNWVLDPGAATAPTGTAFNALASVQTLPDYERSPESLALSTSSAGSNIYADLIVDAGAQLRFDPGASFSAQTDSRILFDGVVTAPGGTVTLAINPGGFISAAQAIWLGPDSSIDVSGTVVHTPNPFGLDTGTVFNAGSVSVSAGQGFLLTASGSQIDASGTAALLNQVANDVLGLPYASQLTVGQSGSISLSAAAGLFLGGALQASAAPAPGAAGGALSVTLLGQTTPLNLPEVLPQVPATLRLATSSSVPWVEEGTTLPLSLLGSGVLPASTIVDGGFDQVRLTVRNELDNNGYGFQGGGIGTGTLSIDSGVALSPAVALVLDTPEIQVNGSGTVGLSSAYVALGSDYVGSQSVDPNPQSGSASLSISGQFVDLMGNFTLEGLAAATIRSTGDIRAIGTLLAGSTQPQGALTIPGDLTLTAQQIYPSTLSNYAINVLDTTQPSALTITQAPGAPDAVLSAGGAFTLQATSIVSSGTLRAPIGSITLVGQDVTLGAGSLTSVSADNLSIPFGQTQGGLSWVYPFQTGGTLVYGFDSGSIPLPQKQVSIQAQQINLAHGAQVDLSGGGDLIATEFTPGIGGTNDVLSQSVSPKTYAVLPDQPLDFAPYDPLIEQAGSYAPNQSVYLSGGNGLPAGTYALLPARYALLPGAYLVTLESGYTNLGPGTQLPQLDGSVIVSGRLVYGGTTLGATQTSGFDIQPGSYALQEAQYTVTSANAFFPSQAAAANVGSFELPRDAGDIAIAAGSSLSLAGSVLAVPGSNGRGGSLDLSATNLVVTEGLQSEPAGVVSIDASQLDNLGISSILIGGTRSYGSTTTVDVQADDVTVAAGVTLTAPELLLVANDQIELLSGAAVAASGASVGVENPLTLPSGGALLRVSTGPQTSVSIQGAGGQISIDAGASVAATGSMTISAPAGVDLEGSLQASGASVLLSSNQIALGAVPASFAGTALGDAQLAKLSNTNLTLSSGTDLQLFGPATLDVTQLTLDAPGLDAMGPDAQLNLTAGLLAIQGTSAASGEPPLTGTAVLGATAGQITLSGAFTLNGFGQSSLSASKDLSIAGGGSLATAGTLTLGAGVFESQGGYDYSISAGGQLTTAATAASTGAPTAAPGATLSLQGSAITLGGAFQLPAGSLIAQASGVAGNIEVTAGASLDVSGQGVLFDGLTESSAGGRISLSSSSGNVTVDAGSTLDLSAGTGQGAGGALSMAAPEGAVTLAGSVLGAGGAGSPGASLSVDAQSLNFPALVALATSSGMTGTFSVHERGPGDLILGASQTLQSSQITLTADAGSIDVAGVLNADSSNGGLIDLNAQQNIVVDGQLLATATGNAARGGTIDLFSASGGVYVNADALLNVGGQSSSGAALASTGQVLITMPRSAALSLLAGAPQVSLAGSIEGAAQIQLEGNQVYSVPAGSLPALDELADPSNPLYADATTFMQNAGAIEQAILASTGKTVSVLPGIQIQSPGDLTIGSAFDLSTWRFGSTPGILTLQAAGNVNVDSSITDGFATGSYTLSSTPSASWSYRITAGADLSGANPLGLADPSTLPVTGASVILAPGVPASSRGVPNAPTMIRTGTGFIDIAAAQDLVLGNQASVIYTAGEAGSVGTPVSALQNLPYPVNGGSITVTVARDVVGATSGDLFTDWLWRTAQSSGKGGVVPTAWTVNFGTFEQGIGALAGGDLAVTAGGNILDLGAVLPTVGAPVSGQTAPIEENVGGLLTVSAGGNILGGKFLNMAGSATLSAGGQIGEGSLQAGASRGLYPLLAMGDSQFSVTAASGITIEAVLDPTLVESSSQQSAQTFQPYATYNGHSSVTLLSAGGNVSLINDGLGDSPVIASSANVALDPTRLLIMPGTVNIVALGGDVDAIGTMDLWPAADGNLNLLARGGVNLANIVMSDTDPINSLPTPASPKGSLQVFGLLALDQTNNLQPGFYAPQPVHGGAYAADGQADSVPARVVALGGDITMQPQLPGNNFTIFVPKPIDVVASGNIIDLGLQIDQFAASNVSTIVAGGDLTYPQVHSSNGALQANTREISVSGPGDLVMDVGGSVDLGTSSGIVSYGNLLDPAVSSTGANIYLTAGTGVAASYQSFINTYLAGNSQYSSNLIQYMGQLTGNSDWTTASALTAFEALTPGQQQPLVEDILVDELRAGGRAAAAAGAGHDNFTRAFDALEALFPGSNPDLASGQTNPYSGDIDLYFSQIYTRAGGDINLFAPGGSIDVGLAAAPTSFGVEKSPSSLGIVAQSTGSVSAVAYGSIDVNQSRVFAADGGNIMLWSTEGNIDAGRGAKSAISAPPPTISFSGGQVVVTFPPALTGSGIQALATSTGVSPGDVDLFAPHGVVNANEAGIVAGNLTIAATAVLGTNNISVSGTSVGVPVAVTGVGLAAAAAGSSTASATNSAVNSAVSDSAAREQNAPLAESALAFLEVFVIGLGEEQCAPSDVACLQRQKSSTQ